MMYIIYLMRHSREDKIRSHERIVEVAARRIRESGTEAPSVAEIMETAGMTHGGFYKHFG
jgi:TetR/AcrR family transcriptional repressor of nem operon